MQSNTLEAILKECTKPGHEVRIMQDHITIVNTSANTYQCINISREMMHGLEFNDQFWIDDFIDYIAKSTNAFTFEPRYMRNFDELMHNILNCNNTPGKLYPD